MQGNVQSPCIIRLFLEISSGITSISKRTTGKQLAACRFQTNSKFDTSFSRLWQHCWLLENPSSQHDGTWALSFGKTPRGTQHFLSTARCKTYTKTLHEQEIILCGSISIPVLDMDTKATDTGWNVWHKRSKTHENGVIYQARFRTLVGSCMFNMRKSAFFLGSIPIWVEFTTGERSQLGKFERCVVFSFLIQDGSEKQFVRKVSSSGQKFFRLLFEEIYLEIKTCICAPCWNQLLGWGGSKDKNTSEPDLSRDDTTQLVQIPWLNLTKTCTRIEQEGTTMSFHIVLCIIEQLHPFSIFSWDPQMLRSLLQTKIQHKKVDSAIHKAQPAHRSGICNQSFHKNWLNCKTWHRRSTGLSGLIRYWGVQ